MFRICATLVERRRDLDMLVAIDGPPEGANTQIAAMAHALSVALLVAPLAEGASVLRNRVVAAVSGYEDYFFIEDDVEIVDAAAFDVHKEAALSLGIPHFCLHPRSRLRRIVDTSGNGNLSVTHAALGSAQFMYFCKHALFGAGGWHPAFAKWRRGGHTEHSMRVCRTSRMIAPFNFIQEAERFFIWHNPPSVAWSDRFQLTSDGLLVEEQELIDAHITLSGFGTPTPFVLCSPGPIHDPAWRNSSFEAGMYTP